MRAEIASLRVIAGAGTWRGSISVGVAQRRPGMASFEALIKAADDAVALIDALSTSSTVAEALQRYEALRVPFGCHVVGYARQLGAYLQAQLKTQEERDAAERHFSPEAVLRDTATVGFMTV